MKILECDEINKRPFMYLISQYGSCLIKNGKKLLVWGVPYDHVCGEYKVLVLGSCMAIIKDQDLYLLTHDDYNNIDAFDTIEEGIKSLML